MKVNDTQVKIGLIRLMNDKQKIAKKFCFCS